jgi:hypothetical protein
MSEAGNFIARWSRRKRQATQDAQPTQPAPVPPPDADAGGAGAKSDAHTSVTASASPGGPAESLELPFDVASLPPIESITAESDIRAFLAPGVPPELTRAALRRVWTADPAIRDFVGLAENAWDFNAPDSISGFGPLEMTDELRRQVARIVGGGLPSDEDEAPSLPQAGQTLAAAGESCVESVAETSEPGNSAAPEAQWNGQEQPSQQDQFSQSGTDVGNPTAVAGGDAASIASQHNPAKPDDIPATAKPSHGAALPKE